MVPAIDMTQAVQAAPAAQPVQAAAPQAGIGVYLLIIALAVILAVLLGFIHYVNVRHQKDNRQKERSPVLAAAFVTLVVLFIALAGTALGQIEPEWLKEHWYIFSLIFVVVYLMLLFEAQKRQPKSIDALKGIAEDAIDEKLGYESDDWKDDGFVPSIEHLKVVEDERLQGLRRSVAYFVLYRNWRAQKRRFLVGLNAYTGYPVEIKLMPEQHRIDGAMMDQPATPAGETDDTA